MTNTSRNTIVGLFQDEPSARAVVDDLIRNGFSQNDVHLSSSENYVGDAAAGGAGLSGRAPAEQHGGGFMGWLNSIFGADETDEDRTRYSEAVQRGGYVVAVDADANDRDRAIDVMNDHGVLDLDDHAAKHGYGATTSSAPAISDTRRGEPPTGAIPVVQEELRIGKRAVQRGGVRVYSRVTEQPVEQNVNLREEKVTVERQPVNRPLSEAERTGLRDQTIEVTEMAEEPVIEKQARVVEEVRVGKQSTERTQKVRDTVRRTDVQTENLGTTRGTNYEDDFRNDFQTRYGTSGADYQSYAPAYEYGYKMAGNPQYKGANFDEVESTLKTDYLRNNPNSTWDQAKGAVRYGWEKVTGKR
jgi:uncharacterized protein (TIGR02271 family)